MKRYQFNKLIRNKLPVRMRNEGVIITGTSLTREEYTQKLKHKLVEESGEALASISREELKTELADVVEVLTTLAEASGISMEEIEEARRVKQVTNGVFSSDNYIHYIEVDKNNTKVIEYLDNKRRSYIFQASADSV